MNQKYLQILAAFVVGILLALGLGISGMVQPQKVIGFLNIKGNWDPTLLFVMMGAIPVHFLAYRFIKGKASPLFDIKWHVPTSKEITKPLIFGAIIFGLGWGLVGICPGPALVSVASGSQMVAVFLITMTLGMLLNRVYSRALEKIKLKRKV